MLLWAATLFTIKMKSDVDKELINLSKFKLKRLLQNNCSRKLLCVEGSFTDQDGPAVILFEKKIFPSEEEAIQTTICNQDTKLKKTFENDIYGSYECFPIQEHNGETNDDFFSEIEHIILLVLFQV